MKNLFAGMIDTMMDNHNLETIIPLVPVSAEEGTTFVFDNEEIIIKEKVNDYFLNSLFDFQGFICEVEKDYVLLEGKVILSIPRNHMKEEDISVSDTYVLDNHKIYSTNILEDAIDIQLYQPKTINITDKEIEIGDVIEYPTSYVLNHSYYDNSINIKVNDTVVLDKDLFGNIEGVHYLKSSYQWRGFVDRLTKAKEIIEKAKKYPEINLHKNVDKYLSFINSVLHNNKDKRTKHKVLVPFNSKSAEVYAIDNNLTIVRDEINQKYLEKVQSIEGIVKHITDEKILIEVKKNRK